MLASSSNRQHKRTQTKNLESADTSNPKTEFVDNRPSTLVQAKMIEDVQKSPKLLAQRKAHNQLFSTQMMSEDEEELVQKKLKPPTQLLQEKESLQSETQQPDSVQQKENKPQREKTSKQVNKSKAVSINPIQRQLPTTIQLGNKGGGSRRDTRSNNASSRGGSPRSWSSGKKSKHDRKNRSLEKKDFSFYSGYDFSAPSNPIEKEVKKEKKRIADYSELEILRLSAEDIGNLKAEDLNHLQDKIKFLFHFSFVSGGALKGLKPAYIPNLTISQIKKLTVSQVNSLTADQVGEMKFEFLNRLAYKAGCLKPSTFEGIKPDFFSNVTTEFVKRITSEQIMVLSTEKINKLGNKIENISYFSSIDKDKIKAIDSALFKFLKPFQVESFSTAQIEELDQDKINTLNNDSIKSLRVSRIILDVIDKIDASKSASFCTRDVKAFTANT